MAYYNPAAEQSSFDPEFSQSPDSHMVAHPQMVVQPHYPVQLTFGKYASGYSRITSVCLGVLQIGLSWLSVAAAVMALVFDANGAAIGTGFWCGVIYLTAGIVHITAGVKPTNELIIAATVFSTLVFPFGVAQLTLSVIGLTNDIVCGDSFCFTSQGCAVVANVAMGNVGLFEMIFGLCLFIVGCHAWCCSPKPQMILLANDVTAGMLPNELNATAPTQTTQNFYTVEQNTYEEIPNDQHRVQASAPEYSHSDGKHKDLD